MPPVKRGLGTEGSALWGAGAGRAPKHLAPSKGSPPYQKEIPAGKQAVQACFAQPSLRR